MIKTLAILTPTYNRAKLLKRLYNSLLNQTQMDFVWYVIDDGSTDDTNLVISEFINNKNKFEIFYKQKQNGGKHSAINEGLKFIEEPLTLIVDSDDFLQTDAVERIVLDYKQIKDKQDICGLGYLKEETNGKIVGKPYTKDGVADTFVNQRYNKNTFGDKCEVFKTEILKQYPFPEFEGENFVSEATVWCKMSGPYKMIFFNRSIYVCEYQPDGLTASSHKRLFNNPQGAVECYKQLTTKQFRFKLRCKYTIAYIAYSLSAQKTKKQIIEESINKTLTRVLFFAGKCYYKRLRNSNK